MARLNAMIDALRETAREEWGETVLDEIVSAAEDDASIFEEKITSLEAGNAELTTQISSLKNELYDLSKLIPKADETDPDTDIDDEDDEDPDADPIDDFFVEEN